MPSINNILPPTKERKQELKQVLAKYHLQPSKKMRQNFLVDQIAIKKLINSSHIKKNDTIIEIGAGLGTLTEIIAQKSKNVIAIEKDTGLFQLLRDKFNKYNNIKLIKGDILNIDINGLGIKIYKIIANLPFNITFEVVKKFLTLPNPPISLNLIVQREVGERICSRTNKNNFWSIFVQLYARSKIIGHLKRNVFWPQPNVNIVIIQIQPHKSSIDNKEKKRILKLVKIGFRHPRKQLINNLKEGLKLKGNAVLELIHKSKISPKVRAERLSLEDWKHLSKSYSRLRLAQPNLS